MKVHRIAIAIGVALVILLLLSLRLQEQLRSRHIGDQPLVEARMILSFSVKGEYQKEADASPGKHDIVLFDRKTNRLDLQFERIDHQVLPMAGWTTFLGSYSARSGAALGRPISELTNVHHVRIPPQLSFERSERAREGKTLVLRLTLNGKLTHEVTNSRDFDASSQLIVTNHGLAQLLQR